MAGSLFGRYITELLEGAVSRTSISDEVKVIPWNAQPEPGWNVRWSFPAVSNTQTAMSRSAVTYNVIVTMSAPEGFEEEFESQFLNYHDDTTLIHQLAHLDGVLWDEFQPALVEVGNAGLRLEATVNLTLTAHIIEESP